MCCPRECLAAKEQVTSVPVPRNEFCIFSVSLISPYLYAPYIFLRTHTISKDALRTGGAKPCRASPPPERRVSSDATMMRSCLHIPSISFRPACPSTHYQCGP